MAQGRRRYVFWLFVRLYVQFLWTQYLKNALSGFGDGGGLAVPLY